MSSSILSRDAFIELVDTIIDASGRVYSVGDDAAGRAERLKRYVHKEIGRALSDGRLVWRDALGTTFGGPLADRMIDERIVVYTSRAEGRADEPVGEVRGKFV